MLLAPAGFYAGISLHEPIHTALVNWLMRALGSLLFEAVAVAAH